MGARPQPAPEGYEVVKAGHRWLILITPRDARGELVSFGYVADPHHTTSDGRPMPAQFPRRGQAVTYAQFHQLAEENAQLRRQIQGRAVGGVKSSSASSSHRGAAVDPSTGAAGAAASAVGDLATAGV